LGVQIPSTAKIWIITYVIFVLRQLLPTIGLGYL